MCGLLGNFGYIETQDLLNHINEVEPLLKRRGPDQIESIDIENFYGVHSRLIVQGDASDGKQPMVYKDIVLLFNGNLYNKDTLKSELLSLGYEFKGISDTEVVAISISHWGNKAFEKFNGFFSIVYFDKKKKTLTLARDRVGQKPLYYSSSQKSVFFGSTENLIPKRFCGKIRQESYIDFITYGFVPSPNTMFENLYSVKPGYFKSFSLHDGKVLAHESYSFWQPMITNEIDDLETATTLITDTLDYSMKDGLFASIDVACLFSGGVDSSLIFSNARNKQKGLCGFTADFGEHDDSEQRASSLAKVLGHENHIIKKIDSSDVEDSLKLTPTICESPFDDTSVIPSNIVFSAIKASGYSVALTGDGADELFCGYSSFGNLNKIEKLLDKKFDFLIRFPGKIINGLLSRFRYFDLERLFMNEKDLLVDLSCNGFKKREWQGIIRSDYDPLHYVTSILKDLSDLRPLDKWRILNLKFKLPYQMLYKVDRASMFNSVEARPLFLNNDIIDAALSISSSVMMEDGQKTILKKLYQNQIPHSGWNLPKTGFGWKTNSYEKIFNDEANSFLKRQTKIDGNALLKRRKMHHKRAYYGLFSLVSWLESRM